MVSKSSSAVVGEAVGYLRIGFREDVGDAPSIPGDGDVGEVNLGKSALKKQKIEMGHVVVHMVKVGSLL